MPERASRVCARSGCNALSKARFCDAHKDHDRRTYDRNRSNKELRKLYRTSQWAVTRGMILQRDVLCSMCKRALSTVCHHAIPAVKWVASSQDFFDPSNLAGCCKPCHDAHTATQDSMFAASRSKEEGR